MLGSRLAAELSEHRSRSPYKGEDERAFANPRTGHAFDANCYAEIVRFTYKQAGVEGYV